MVIQLVTSKQVRDPSRHGFPGTILLWVLKNFVPVSRKIRLIPLPPSSKLSKRDDSVNVCEHFDFRTFVENITEGQPLTGRERKMCGLVIVGCGVRLRRVCGGKSVSELSV